MSLRKNIYKLGSASSNIIELDKTFQKFHQLNSLKEYLNIKNGIEILSKHSKSIIQLPISIELKENNILFYEQEKLSPWIEAKWITGEQLYKLSETILLQQELLVENELCLVDARPSNYWLGSNKAKLVDLASIKKISQQNFLSFERDFKNNFINPLSLEKDYKIPVSNFFKGDLNAINLNLSASVFNLISLTRFKEVLKNSIIEFTSNKISSSSPEFIDFLNSHYDKKIGFNINNVRRSIKNLKNLLKKVKPKKIIKSNWDEYNNFHEESYTMRKIGSINDFVKKYKSKTKIVDLGSNLTTKDINNIDLRIDNDLSVCRQMRQFFDDSKIILQLNIADCLCSSDSIDFKALNLYGNAEAAIMTSIIHHLLIDYGLPIEGFYKNLSKLYTNILLEFPTSNDPMVNLLINKRNESVIWDWEKIHVPTCSKYFEISNKYQLSNSRFIYELKRNNI